MNNLKTSKVLPRPTVYKTFEGIKEINGFKRKYWIQDLTEEYFDEIIHHYSTGFIKDEPLCKYIKLHEDPESIEDFKRAWRQMLNEHLSLICLYKDKKGEIKIAGCNILGRAYKGQKNSVFQQFKARRAKSVVRAYNYVFEIKNVWSELNIEEFMTVLGLYVLPEFRGERIGLKILEARRDIALAVGLTVSITGYTSVKSQEPATKVGFQTFYEISYEDLAKIDPDMTFPGITEFTPTLRYMFIRYV